MSADQPLFRNADAPVADRVLDLLTLLEPDEKIALLQTAFPGVERLGIPAFQWGGECLHGLVHTGRATVFPVPIALAATFDDKLVHQVATAIAKEARAKYHDPAWRGSNGFISLGYWTPNINLFRDPRWGRGQETWGEDPELTGRLGAAFVRGLQGDDPERLRLAACAKHYAVHSGPEALRNGFDAQVSPKLLHETYLPHFQRLVDAGAATVMGAYNAVNGVPCSGHDHLLNEVLRERWGFTGFTVSDAGAVSCFHLPKQGGGGGPDAVGDDRWAHLTDTVKMGHGVTSDAVESAAYALNNGCDMAIGTEIARHAGEALTRGLISDNDLDRAAGRILGVMIRLGALDDEAEQATRAEPASVIASKKHRTLAHRAAVRSAVLLKNDGVLPLRDVRRVAVSGPTAADAEVLLGNFYRGISGELVTLVEGLVRAAPEGTTVTYMPGCNLRQPNLFDSTWAFGLAEWADVAVVGVGTTPLMEGENGECILTETGGDRDLMGLPEVQLEYLRKLRRTLGDKKLVAVVTGGSPLICPELHELADAVLWAWYPGEQGGAAMADILFGAAEPGGRLPFTVPKDPAHVPDVADYSMRARTYRYGCPEPLYPFGFGLGYGRVAYADLELAKARLARGKGTKATVTVRNTGERAVDEVVQLYLADHHDAAAGGPQVNLRDIKRVALEPGESKTVRFTITPAMLERVNEDGEREAHAGTFTVSVGPCAPGARGEELGAPAGVHAELVVG